MDFLLTINGLRRLEISNCRHSITFYLLTTVRTDAPVREASAASKSPLCQDFSPKFVGKADWMDIFAFEELSHESGRKPLSLAQIRTLEPCA
jgi:hypothetical protein